jgi:2-oxoglutarate ferredoxin oxidoreductase subunit delta
LNFYILGKILAGTQADSRKRNGKMARGKPEIDRELCTGCALCVPACPQVILAMSAPKKRGRKAVVLCVDEELCIACDECAQVCPTQAIRIWSFSIVAGG